MMRGGGNEAREEGRGVRILAGCKVDASEYRNVRVHTKQANKQAIEKVNTTTLTLALSKSLNSFHFPTSIFLIPV
jgi:hypothetical protein